MNQLSENVKALFFAQYIGQELFEAGKLIGVSNNVVYGETPIKIIGLQNPVLLLRKVEQLTDEEIGIIANIIGCKLPSFERYISYLLIRDDDDQPYPLGRSGFTFKIWYSDQTLEVVINGRIGQILNQLSVFDYLRSIGILLPFTFLQDGNPKTLTPEQIVEMGWVRIKK